MFKTQRNKCDSLRGKRIITFIEDVTKKAATSKSLWKFVRLFLTHRNCQKQKDIVLIDNDKVIDEVLSQPLADAMNNSISKGVFPDNAKVTTVSPVNKQLTSVNFLPYIAAYSESYNTLFHEFIRLLEEWRKNLDKSYVVGGVLMNLSKAFDYIPHDLLIAKLSEALI